MANDRSPPPEDPLTLRARARHAAMAEAARLERSGDPRGALALWEAFESDDARPAWLWSHLESLRRATGDAAGADLALLAAAERSLAAARTGEAMTTSGSIVRVARQLAEAGRVEAAVHLLETARGTLDDVIAGRKTSISARVPGQVRDEIAEALAALPRAAGPPEGGGKP